jgi:hypothetical protein
MTMALSTLEAPIVRRTVCPNCGHPVALTPRQSWIEIGLGLLAAAALALMLAPLGIMAWKSCTNYLSERESHSIIFQPLEDWTRY